MALSLGMVAALPIISLRFPHLPPQLELTSTEMILLTDVEDTWPRLLEESEAVLRSLMPELVCMLCDVHAMFMLIQVW